MKNQLSLLIFLLMAMGLAACNGQDPQKKASEQTYVVKKEPFAKTLYFTGTIQPLRETALTNPVEAVIEDMFCHYGQAVKKGEIIFTLNSPELQKQYNDVLTDYLRAKDNYSVTKAKFAGTQELWNAGLLAKNSYLSEKSNLDITRISLMQTTRKLNEILEKMNEGLELNLSSLKAANFEKVKQILARQHNLIHLRAPSDGVLLFPPKTNESKDKLGVGSAVKAGQVIALIGDLNGISLEIDITEVDINQIHPGMPATITGIALGKNVLHGEIVAVNAQASNVSDSSLPSFKAIVAVKTLTPQQQAWVKVGMSATIALSIASDEQLLIPIAAIKQEKGKSVVSLKTSKGLWMNKIITTGEALAEKVIVLSGLQAGDVVSYG